MFSVIVTMSTIYQAAIESSRQAEQTLLLSSAVPIISELIAEDLQTKKSATSLQGRGEIQSFKYSWVAQVVATGDNLFSSGADLLNLWKVSFIVYHDDKQKSYTFYEVVE